MGIVDKFKNLFTVEVEEEPIKKEIIQVEIESPIKREEKEEVVIEKKEEKVLQPVFFDDQEFDSITRTNTPKRETYLKKEKEAKKEAVKFKPTPIISPIYGVLDKNYSKEDVKHFKQTDFEFTRTDEITIDDIRKKAYGTLEDELEITLFKEKIIKPAKTEIDMFDELEDMDSLEELNDLDTKETELLKEIKDDNVEEDNLDLNKEDLFDLIDSMYEKRGEE